MAAIAILVGTADYRALNPLPCCRNDIAAVASLLQATGRFDAVHDLVDRDAAGLKRELRGVLEPLTALDELFFYFSGHGHIEEGEFYFCPQDFNPRRPNETGLSHSELSVLLREAGPELAVLVVDACSAGTPLIKSDQDFLPTHKGGLKKVVRIAACAESETALGGERLSPFTERFCLAASRAAAGPVYYTDIIGSLRDAYLQDQDRAPQFVFQASARETFIDEAERLTTFRESFEAQWLAPAGLPVPAPPPEDRSLSFSERLAALDAKMASPEDIPAFMGGLFDGLVERLGGEEFGEAFELTTAEHKDFNEHTTRAFIIRVLSQQKRSDEFVTASITKDRRRRNNLLPALTAIAMGFSSDDEVSETWALTLNMRLDRAQLRITLTPKFAALQRIVLVVSCAPSLQHCYVFELATRHPRTDWNSFATDGVEITRRWYKESWDEEPEALVDTIADKLVADVESLLRETTGKLDEDAD